MKFADGSERTLPLHGVTQFQVLDVLDELGIKAFSELEFKPTASLATIRMVQKVAALALMEMATYGQNLAEAISFAPAERSRNLGRSSSL